MRCRWCSVFCRIADQHCSPFIRQIIRPCRSMGPTLTVKQVVALAYWSLSLNGLQVGLATKLNSSDADKIAFIAQVRPMHHCCVDNTEIYTCVKQHFASQAPLLVSVGLTRCSVAMLGVEIMNNSGTRRKHIASVAGVCAMACWTLSAPLITMVECAPIESDGRWVCPGEVREGTTTLLAQD